MKQKLNVLVDGTCYEVEIEDLNQSPLQVTVNGKTYSVEVEGASTSVRPVAPAAPQPACRPSTGPGCRGCACGHPAGRGARARSGGK